MKKAILFIFSCLFVGIVFAQTTTTAVKLDTAKTKVAAVLDMAVIPNIPEQIMTKSGGATFSELSLYIFMLLGVIVHILLKGWDNKTQKSKINWYYHFKYSIIGAILMGILIYCRTYIPDNLFPYSDYIKNINPLFAGFIGYFADSAAKNLETSKKVNNIENNVKCKTDFK
jgi:hypothetical protein